MHIGLSLFSEPWLTADIGMPHYREQLLFDIKKHATRIIHVWHVFLYALFVAVYSGMLPCFFGGLLWFLLRAISSARISLLRVSRGMITSSTSPRSAAR